MRRHGLKWWVLLLLPTLAVAAQTTAAPTSTEPTTEQKLATLLAERYPTVKVQSVQPSAVPGLYEVKTADRLVYVDASGDYLIIGQVMHTQSKQNLTEARWNELNRIDFASLPFEHAIKIVKGNGSRQLVAFEDPLCPYCAELEKSLASLNDYTLYVFLMPLENIHPGATRLARRIWCAPDPAQAWSEWMQQDKQPPAAECGAVPGEQLAALANKLAINSTPTLYFADGIKIASALTASEIEQRWASIK